MIFLLLLLIGTVSAQAPVQIYISTTVPMGACNPRSFPVLNPTTGAFYVCKANVWTNIAGGGGGPGGTVTSVGALSPLFTTANPTTTPTFSLISQAANQFFASPDGGAGVAAFRSIVAADLPSSGTGLWTVTGSDIYNSNAGNVGIGAAPGNYKLDVGKSGSSGTLRVFDRTAVTGVTHGLMQAGAANPTTAGDAGAILSWKDVNGNTTTAIANDGSFGIYGAAGGARKITGYTNYFKSSSDACYKWSNNADVDMGTVDLSLCRNAAGVLEINNGTPGMYASGKWSAQTLTSLGGGGTQCVNTDNNGLLGTTACSAGGTVTLVTVQGTTNHITSSGTCTITTTGTCTFDLAGRITTRQFGATFTNSGAAIVAGATAYFTLPFACTISAWNITISPADTATIDIWKIATGTAIPTVANTIVAAAAPAISSGTAVHSTTLTGWTTTVTANDIFGINLKTVGGTATQATLTTECDQ